MNFSGSSAQTALPQFSEILRSSGSDPLLSDSILTTSADVIKQPLNNISQNRFHNSLLNFRDTSNAFIEFCENPSVQTLNIPTQSNSILNVQSQILPMKVVQNMCMPQDNSNEKIDISFLKTDNDDLCNPQIFWFEYIQKLQSGTISLPIQQILKMQLEQAKKETEQDDEQKADLLENNILNIPNVQIYKNPQILNDSQFLNDNTIIAINPINMILETQTENNVVGIETHTENQNLTEKVENTNPKTQTKTKFRPKMGEMKMVFTKEGKPKYQCPECSSTFSDVADTKVHLQKHLAERKFKCEFCDAQLKRREHLDQHIRGHSDDRPFICQICKKGFKRNEHLTRHSVVHSGKKNFVCTICNKAFSRKDHLTKHTQTHSTKKRPKLKKESNLEANDVDVTINAIASNTATSMLGKSDLNGIFKEGGTKQEGKVQQISQQLQNIDPKLVFSILQEHLFQNGTQQAVNMNEILPQSTRYFGPT